MCILYLFVIIVFDRWIWDRSDVNDSLICRKTLTKYTWMRMYLGAKTRCSRWNFESTTAESTPCTRATTSTFRAKANWWTRATPIAFSRSSTTEDCWRCATEAAPTCRPSARKRCWKRVRKASPKTNYSRWRTLYLRLVLSPLWIRDTFPLNKVSDFFFFYYSFFYHSHTRITTRHVGTRAFRP